MNRERGPGGALLHPFAVASLVVLLFNDHVLKRSCPGLLTGKLSDFAGVLLLPLFLHALFEVGHARIRGREANAHDSNRVLMVAVALTIAVFALPELSPTAEAVYRSGLAALQWPYWALGALLEGRALPLLRPVQATADPTDLLALPLTLVAYRVARRSILPRRHWKLTLPLIVVLFAVTPAAALGNPSEARGSHVHDGFYLGFELGPAAAFLDSTASISNGFQQEIPSSAKGIGFLGGGIELGGTLPNLGLVLGGRVGFTRVYSPVVETLGQRFTLEDHSLGLWNTELIIEYYPDPSSGLHVGAGVGVSSIVPDIKSTRSTGAQQDGWCASIELGHGFWVGRQWTLGIVTRLTAAWLQGDAFGRTRLVMPGAYAAFAWH